MKDTFAHNFYYINFMFIGITVGLESVHAFTRAYTCACVNNHIYFFFKIKVA